MPENEEAERERKGHREDIHDAHDDHCNVSRVEVIENVRASVLAKHEESGNGQTEGHDDGDRQSDVDHLAPALRSVIVKGLQESEAFQSMRVVELRDPMNLPGR